MASDEAGGGDFTGNGFRFEEKKKRRGAGVSFAAPASRVLVTARSKTVSSIVTTNGDLTCFSPTTLSKEDCWEIIKKKLKTEVDNREDLKAIGLQLAEKCKGLLLAVTVIGDALHLKSEEVEWDGLLKLWDLPKHNNQVYRALKLSYNYLPAYLKRCFAYCSIIFPRGKQN
ncbi:putative disease resistance protein RGA3 [Rosa chinensis]|uniref:putative disease resistance protein RGA3 n=1 Tax=Rosa chinensis TaxID=74649 RepID=UPI000D08B6B0|nr:putative disease resistance protein RGA3 [Rosa chinensis]